MHGPLDKEDLHVLITGEDGDSVDRVSECGV
jgi:hypothetical protein